MSVVVNADKFIAGIADYERRFQTMFRNKVRRLVYEGMFRLTKKTPVNTGQAVMNYVASGGVPHGGPPRSAGKAVEATNKLAVGSEKLRAAATAISAQTLAGVNFSDPYKVFWIVNNTPHIGGLEMGLLPEAPYSPRSPAGMFGVTVQELLALLQSQSI